MCGWRVWKVVWTICESETLQWNPHLHSARPPDCIASSSASNCWLHSQPESGMPGVPSRLLLLWALGFVYILCLLRSVYCAFLDPSSAPSQICLLLLLYCESLCLLRFVYWFFYTSVQTEQLDLLSPKDPCVADMNVNNITILYVKRDAINTMQCEIFSVAWDTLV